MYNYKVSLRKGEKAASKVFMKLPQMLEKNYGEIMESLGVDVI